MQVSGEKRQRASPPSQPESPRTNHPAPGGYPAADYYGYPYTGVPASASASPHGASHGMTAAAHAASLVVATAAANAAISPPGRAAGLVS